MSKALNTACCLGDGANGHTYLRQRLAAWLTRLGCTEPGVIASLQSDMPDDAWDEDYACEWLTENGCDDRHFVAFVDGDLMVCEVAE